MHLCCIAKLKKKLLISHYLVRLGEGKIYKVSWW